ncbi:MAG: ComEC/Rec2 family competence protein [Candidatus Aminicenantia bacterium]
MDRNTKNPVFWILIILFFLNIFAWLVVFDLNKTQFLEVNFFDVGQGDAIFIETPKSHQILIDGGPGPAILEKLGKEMLFWDRTIDLVILTHPEHDHIAGLIEVLKRYRVENILWTGVKRDTSEYQEWVRLIEKEQAKIFIARAGQKICMRTAQPSPEFTPHRTRSGAGARGMRMRLCELYFDILYPFENLEGQEVKNSNNTSVIAKLVFDENSFLFTGDAYKSVERKLVDREVYLQSDVLKVGHHGSKTSTAEEFLEEVVPEAVVVSVGKENRYGHPHPEVLEVLAKYDIRVLRTDEQSDIKIISDGNNLKIEI